MSTFNQLSSQYSPVAGRSYPCTSTSIRSRSEWPNEKIITQSVSEQAFNCNCPRPPQRTPLRRLSASSTVISVILTVLCREVCPRTSCTAPREVELVGEKFDERLIRGGVHGRRGDLDLEFVAEGFADFIAAGARLEF